MKSWRIYNTRYDDEYLRGEREKKKSFIRNQPYCSRSRFIYFDRNCDRCYPSFNENKKQLNIEFLAGHFSLLNENPLTVFTVGYRVKRGLFITPLFVVWSLVVSFFFFFFPIPFFLTFPSLSTFVLPPFTLSKYRRPSSFSKLRLGSWPKFSRLAHELRLIIRNVFFF